MRRTLKVGRDIEVHEVADRMDLVGMREDWSDLWERSASATPFQAPEWLVPWWEYFGRGELRTLALRRGGRLVGLVPLYIDDDGTLRLLGTGNTDYLDGVFEPGYEAPSAAAMLRHLSETRQRWDRCDLHQLRDGSPLLSSPSPDGISDAVTEQNVCPRLSLSGDGVGHAIPRDFLKQVRYYRRRTSREGEVSFERADNDTADQLFEALRRLHGARWREKDEPGMLAGEATHEFQHQVMRAMLARDVLRLYGFRLDGQIVACYYGFIHRDHAYYYLSGFNPDLSKLGLGHQIVFHAIEEAYRDGAKTFDFLRGDEEYKYRWGAVDCPNRRRLLSPEPRSTAAASRQAAACASD